MTRLARWLTEVRLAASFLTIIPVGRNPATATEVASSLGWFPLVGFVVGAVLVCADYLLAFVAGPVRAIVLVLTLTVICGAVHLDGLADTADALGAGCERTRVLEILRDSRIGSFAAAAVFFVLALKIAALACASGHSRRVALYLAPGFARWAMVAVPYKMIYLRERGAGSPLLGPHDVRNLQLATIIALIGSLPTAPILALRGLIVTIILVWMSRTFYYRWLGGITGDLIGAAGEIVETAVLLALTA
jgi:adenosylcobinamide-GDP ribazoletransferase